jgi:hypothetical protein
VLQLQFDQLAALLADKDVAVRCVGVHGVCRGRWCEGSCDICLCSFVFSALLRTQISRKNDQYASLHPTVLGTYWELIPANVTKALLVRLVNSLAFDASSAQVGVVIFCWCFCLLLSAFVC